MADEVLTKAGLKKAGQRIYNYIDTKTASPFKTMDYADYQELSEEEKLANILYILTNAPTQHGSAIPPGTIIAIAGTASDVPIGWAICNGELETPDLRGRFILGASDSHPVGETGGTDSIEIGIESVSGVRVTNDHKDGSLFSGGQNAVIPTEENDESQATAAAHMPPYYALLYIMKLEQTASTSTVLYYKGQELYDWKGPDQAGIGIVITDGTINIEKPFRGYFAKAEYEALPEAERNRGVFIVDDGVDEDYLTVEKVNAMINTAITGAVEEAY